jgi:hypothetical protein
MWQAENPGAAWEEIYKLPSELICVVFLEVTNQSISNLRNANDYYILQHRTELVKRLPLYSFPAALE